MASGERQQAQDHGDSLVGAAAVARSMEDLAQLLRTLRRRHARANRDSSLTYRELAARIGWSQTAVAEYFTASTLPPTDRFDALVEVLGATPVELRALADARDRVEETRRRAKYDRAEPETDSPAADKPSSGPAPATMATRQLPAGTALFTGRAQESAKLLELAAPLADGRMPGVATVFVIDGIGGVGKTALAIHAGHLLASRYPDGQLFLDLYGFAEERPPRDPGEALAELLGSLGVPPKQIPEQRDARAALYRDRLSGTRTLVLLDNAADEAQIRPLLPPAGCLALVTSRRRLRALDDAVPLPLDVLPQPEAVELVRKAARAHSDGEEADDRWETVAERCGRLPLALLIAGALLRTGGRAWSLQRLIDRLTPEAGRELAGYTDETRSLTAVFDLSYRNLAADEQLLLRRLGLLPGSELDAYAAAALMEVDLPSAERLLDRLADHNLLAGVSIGRYRLHDLLRAYAGDLALTIDSEPARAAAQDRLLSFWAYAAHTASVRSALYPKPVQDGPGPANTPDFAGPEAARAWLRTERGNLEAAYAHARAHGLDSHVTALAAGFAEIVFIDGPWTYALEIHHAALKSAERLNDPAGRATALADLGQVLHLTGDYPRARTARTQALEIYRALGDRLGEANVLVDLGRMHSASGDNVRANQAMTQALEVYRALGNRLGEASALDDLGRVQQQSGDYAGAVQTLTRTAEIYRALGNRNGEASTLTNLGRTQYAAGDHRAAADLHLRALNTYRELGNRLGEANALTELARVRHATGQYAAAADLHLQALTTFRELGNRLGEANVLTELGRVRHATGQYAAAADLHLRALKTYRALGRYGDHAVVLNYYADTLAATGQGNRAHKLYQRALVLHRALNKPDDEAVSLEGIGRYHLDQGDTVEGLSHLHQALDIYQRLGIAPDMHRVRNWIETVNGDTRTTVARSADS